MSTVVFDDSGAEAQGIAAQVGTQVSRWGLATGFDRPPRLAATSDPAAFSTQTIIRDYTAASKEWMLSGTNAADANSILYTTGGISLTTAGANNDQMIVSPLVINSVQQGGWGSTNWTPDRMPKLSLSLAFAAAITSVRAIFGLKLTTALDYSTDADHAMFVFDTAVGTAWQCYSRVATVDQNVGAAGNFLKSSPQLLTRYDLEIAIDSYRRPIFSIDGVAVGVGPQLTSTAAFKPVFAIQALTGSARQVYLMRSQLALNI